MDPSQRSDLTESLHEVIRQSVNALDCLGTGSVALYDLRVTVNNLQSAARAALDLVEQVCPIASIPITDDPLLRDTDHAKPQEDPIACARREGERAALQHLDDNINQALFGAGAPPDALSEPISEFAHMVIRARIAELDMPPGSAGVSQTGINARRFQPLTREQLRDLQQHIEFGNARKYRGTDDGDEIYTSTLLRLVRQAEIAVDLSNQVLRCGHGHTYAPQDAVCSECVDPLLTVARDQLLPFLDAKIETSLRDRRDPWPLLHALYDATPKRPQPPQVSQRTGP